MEKIADKLPVEILPNITSEEMTAMFISNKLVKQPYSIWQLNSCGHRYYYKYNDFGIPEFYPSVTTILSQTLPKSKFLINWIASKGIEEAERYKSERASYGSFMHSAFEELLINSSYNLDDLKDKLKAYIEANRLPDDFIYYADELKKDVLSFAQFVLDYDVRPLAIEIALVHPLYKYAGMIDCPCTMLSSIGKKERITAIIDFKSRKNGFYEDAEIQLHMYKELWNYNYPNMQIDRVFNFSPKDWKKSPSYNLKDQTESPNAKKISALLELATIEDSKKDNVFTHVSGIITLDTSTDLTKNITSLTLAELLKKAPKEQKEETESQKKTAIKRGRPKKSVEASKKPNKATKKKKATVIHKRTNLPKTAKKGSKENLLNECPEI